MGRSFGVIWTRISVPRSLRSGTSREPDSSVPLMCYDLSDLRSMMLIRDHPKGMHSLFLPIRLIV